MTDASRVLLVHGGLWEDTGADWFWRRTGVSAGLTRRGLTVLAPDRLRRATNWAAEAARLASAAGPPGPGLTVVGGSFGCAAAARLVLDHPGLAARLLLAWPASLADPSTAAGVRAELARQGASGATLDALLGPGTLPSATDAELAALGVPVAVVASVPPNPLHPRAAVDVLLGLLPAAVELPGCPEPPRPQFPAYREAFLDAVTAFARG